MGFQFLVVRLEELEAQSMSFQLLYFNSLWCDQKSIRTFKDSNISTISIPCGAIRSSNAYNLTVQVPLFQFLVVRLEVTEWEYCIVHIIFQFLVVRLEGYTIQLSGRLSIISIPCGAIRSLTAKTASEKRVYFNSLWCDQKIVKQIKTRLFLYFNSLWCDQKAKLSKEEKAVLKFQFLVVRLEASFKLTSKSSNRFQFLVVRLEEQALQLWHS